MTPWYGRYGQSQKSMPQWWQSQQDSKKGGWENKGSWCQGSGKQWWECKDTNCISVLKKSGRRPRTNSPSSMECDICGTHWNSPKQLQECATAALKKEVMEVKQAQLLGSDGSTVNVTVPTDQEEVWMGSDDEAPPSTIQLALTQEYIVRAALLGDPRELKEPLTPAQSLAVHRPGKTPPDLGRLQEELEDQQAFLALQVKKIAGGEADVTKKKIEQLSKQIEKLENSTDGAAVAAAEWELALKNFNRAETNRVARTDAATLKAEEHSERLEEICNEQVKAWEAHFVTIRAQRSVRETAWEARRLLLENKALEVVSLAEEKIKEANDRAGSPPAPQADGTEKDKVALLQKQLDNAKSEAADAAQKAQEASNQEKNSLLQRLEALEKIMAESAKTAPVAVQLSMEVAALCHRTVTYTAEELPALKVKPPAPYKRHLVMIAANLQQWLVYPNQPVTFAQLLSGAGSIKTTADAFRVIQDLAGDVIWKRFFGDTAVTDGFYAPFQIREILLASLKIADAAMAEFSKDVDFGKEARERFAALSEEDNNAKKSRTGPYTAF